MPEDSKKSPRESEQDTPAEKPEVAVEESDADELARLKAENEALRGKVAEADKSQEVRSHKARNGWAIAVAVVATLTLSLSIPAIWLNRMVTDTNYYVNTVAPLASDPAIQNAVASAASDAIVKQLDATARIRSLLPTNLAFVAVPIGSAVNDFVKKQTTVFVQSPQFPQIWRQLNQTSHAAFVAAITGRQGGALTVQAGTVTLDVGILAQKVAAQLSKAGLGFASNLPVNKINKQIVLFHSGLLAQMTVYVNWLTQVALLLPILGLLLAIGAFALGADRRRVALWFGWSMLVWTILPLQAILLGQTYVANQLLKLASIPTAAAQNAYTILFAALTHAEQIAIAISVVIIVAALIAGPSRWATAMRGWLTGGISGASSHLDLGPVGTWVGAHMNGMRAIGYAGGAIALLLMPAPRTIAEILWIAVFVIVWLLIVQFVGSAGSAASPAEEEVTAEDNTAA